MAKCLDTKRDCACLVGEQCKSGLPGYCCYYEKAEEPVKKPEKIPDLTEDSPYYRWAHGR